MGKRKQEWTQATFERYIKEGRGRGEGKGYKPWLVVRDVSSKGRSARDAGWKTGREQHFLSDHESRLFYFCEWSDAITDIREQFPLLNLELAMQIAEDIGWKYPRDSESNTPYILTTDFMLTVEQDGKRSQIAWTVKTAKDLEKQAVAARLELERRYYEAEGIDWAIITDKEIPKLLAVNVGWLHSAYKLEATTDMAVDDLRDVASILKFRLQESDLPINRVTTALDKEMNLDPGTALYLFKHLVARKEIIMDVLGTKISTGLSAKAITRVVF